MSSPGYVAFDRSAAAETGAHDAAKPDGVDDVDDVIHDDGNNVV